jgi:WD40 repeat protein
MLQDIICALQQCSGSFYTFRFITSLRGHVQAVYQIAWSPDSRLLVSGSADSTVKGKPKPFLHTQGKEHVDTVWFMFIVLISL